MTAPYRYISSLLPLAALFAAGACPASPVDGSLWAGGNERSMFADKVANAIGDILTIQVNENSTLASSVKMSTSKSANIKNNFTQLLFKDVLARKDGTTPSTDLTTANNTHEGSGTLGNSHSITAEISVQVVDVLPNGNLVLEGVRVITYSGETYYMLTQGICRPADVSTSNTISSSQIADARIEIVAEGSLSQAEKEGWGMKLANRIGP